jgi:hypothetical protein
LHPTGPYIPLHSTPCLLILFGWHLLRSIIFHTLELRKEETCQLLSAAGYSLSDCDTFDLVIQFFLEKEIYDIDTVNKGLGYFSLKPLTGVSE